MDSNAFYGDYQLSLPLNITKINMKISPLFAFLFFVATSVLAQPNNNPYKARYGGVGHWTDSLKWSAVTSVLSFGAIPNDNLDDSAAVQTGINIIHANGGGVLFFPAGTYNLGGHVKIKSGVILRGEDPTGITNARVENYSPPSKLVFPRFELDTNANGGAGNDRKKAFKGISSELECSNYGVVNLDINRAYISFQPQFNFTPGAPHTSPQSIQRNRNVIVYGCRTNNAVIADGGVPSVQQRPWQVFPWRFSANIEIFVFANCVIANNRLNDGTADSFEMPNYIIQRRGTSNWIRLTERTLGTGWRAQFNYTDHYGISLNRAKIYQDTTGRYRVVGVATYGTPETEPDLYRTGFEVLHNWVYKTSRVGIIAAGIGLVIRGNVTLDDSLKVLREFENFTGPVGLVTPQGATTFENRGIDFSGWQVIVDSNYVEATSNFVSGYLSTDGEGILLQECCGGTPVNDYTISNNITANYIGIYKMRDINNLKIVNNEMGGSTIYVVANTNGASYYLNNFLMEGNTNVGNIQAIGSRGGARGVIRNNTGTGNTIASLSCHVFFDPDNNTGFRIPTYRGVDPNESVPLTPEVPGPCAESTTYPIVNLNRPAADTTFDQGLVSYRLVVKMEQGDLSTARAEFYKNSERVATNLEFDLDDSTASYTWDVPPTISGVTTFTTRVAQGNLITFSEVRRFTRITPVVTATDAMDFLRSARLYPNPLNGAPQLSVSFANAAMNAQNTTVQLYDVQGKAIENVKYDLQPQQLVVNTSALQAGYYMLRVNMAGSQKVFRFVK